MLITQRTPPPNWSTPVKEGHPPAYPYITRQKDAVKTIPTRDSEKDSANEVGSDRARCCAVLPRAGRRTGVPQFSVLCCDWSTSVWGTPVPFCVLSILGYSNLLYWNTSVLRENDAEFITQF